MLFSLLQTRLNFTIKWVHVDDNKFGAFDNKNNDWNGIVGMIKRKEIDTSILDLSITAERKSVISYTSPVVRYKNYLFLQRPKQSVSWDTFLAVFDVFYWCVMLVFILLFTGFHFFSVVVVKNAENRKLLVRG